MAVPTPETGLEKPPAVAGIGAKAILRFAVVVLLLPAVLFAAAGSLAWPFGWAYVIVTLVGMLGSRILLLKIHPDLVAERARFDQVADVKRWDRVLAPLLPVLVPLVTYIVAGLDFRFDWSPPFAFGLKLTALALIAAGTAFSSWAMLVNRFFSAVVRIQAERGQTVVTDGPYRLIRHPGYAGGLLAYLATPVVLSSLYAWIPVAVIVVWTIVRTALEDRTLQAELDGYREYARRVRYRLLPGVW